MDQGLAGLAFAAGMIAALNPCGFAMLPAYLALVVNGELTGPTTLTLAPTAASEITGLFEEVADYLDEPLGDSSTLPSYLVSKLAREDVKVAISGDGGVAMQPSRSRFASASRPSWT